MASAMPFSFPWTTLFCLMSDDIPSRVVAILSAVKRIPAESIRPEATLAELGIDSLDKVNILFELETELNIHIPDEEARQLTLVAAIVEPLRALDGKNVAGNGEQPNEAAPSHKR